MDGPMKRVYVPYTKRRSNSVCQHSSTTGKPATKKAVVKSAKKAKGCPFFLVVVCAVLLAISAGLLLAAWIIERNRGGKTEQSLAQQSDDRDKQTSHNQQLLDVIDQHSSSKGEVANGGVHTAISADNTGGRGAKRGDYELARESSIHRLFTGDEIGLKTTNRHVHTGHHVDKAVRASGAFLANGDVGGEPNEDNDRSNDDVGDVQSDAHVPKSRARRQASALTTTRPLPPYKPHRPQSHPIYTKAKRYLRWHAGYNLSQLHDMAMHFGKSRALYQAGKTNVYLAIPYAQRLDTAELQFGEAKLFPRPVSPLQRQENRIFGDVCPQRSLAGYGPAPRNMGDITKCLRLNVIEPSCIPSGTLFPVYVYVHGGGLLRGSSQEAGVNGIVNNLVARGMVVVTVEYRLGAYGFYNFKENGKRGSSVRGIYDVILALKWVQENIGDFRGDKTRVTLGGQSAGACIISMITLAAMDARNTELHTLFSHVIIQSGFVDVCRSGSLSRDSASDMITAELCADRGLNYTDATPAELRDCLTRKCGCPNAANCSTPSCVEHVSNALSVVPFMNMELPDGYFRDPDEMFEAAKAHPLKEKKFLILMGVTRDEWSFFDAGFRTAIPLLGSLPYNTDFMEIGFAKLLKNETKTGVREMLAAYGLNDTDINKNEPLAYKFYIKALTDAVFTSAMVTDAKHYTRLGHDVFLYRFDVPSVFLTFSNASYKFGPMACHAGDLPYVFMQEAYFNLTDRDNTFDEKTVRSQVNTSYVMGDLWESVITDYWSGRNASYLRNGTYFHALNAATVESHLPFIRINALSWELADGPILSNKLLDFWHDFKQRHFSGNRRASLLSFSRRMNDALRLHFGRKAKWAADATTTQRAVRVRGQGSI